MTEIPVYVAWLEEKVSRLTESLESTRAELEEMTWRYNNPERFDNL